MPLIASFDPGDIGGSTGMFLGSYGEHEPLVALRHEVIPGGIEEFVSRYTDFDYYADIYLVEDFAPRLGTPVKSYEPAQIVGAVRMMFCPRVVVMPPAFKNTAVSDDVLKRLGLYSTLGNHHDAREAARHAVRYLKEVVHHEPTIRKGWGDDYLPRP